MIKKIGLVFVLTAMTGVASAEGRFHTLVCDIDKRADICKVNAPEMDPASLMSGLTLMAGGLAVLVGRRKGSLKA